MPEEFLKEMKELLTEEEYKKLLDSYLEKPKRSIKLQLDKISSKELKSKIDGVYFNPKWNEEYSSTYVGLEITDLFSYPIHKYVKRNTKDKAFLTFEDKIVGYPNYKNKGIKTFP